MNSPVSQTPINAANGRARRLLAARGASRARPSFGSHSVVTTVQEHDRRIDVVDELLPLVIDKLRQQGRSFETVTTDAIGVGALVERTLTEVADLCQPTADTASDALRIVVSAKQGQSTDVVARITDATARVVDPAVERVHLKIVALADSAPRQLREVGSAMLESLARAKPPLTDCAANVRRVAAFVARVAEICGREGDFAPDDRRPVIGALREAAAKAVQEAFESLVRELVVARLLDKWPVLTDSAETLLHLEGELVAQLDAVNRERQEWVRERREFLAEPPCNTTLRLPGPSTEEVIASVLERHRFAGRNDLVAHVLERGVGQLRETLAGRGRPDVASLPPPRLLAAVPAREAFAAFRDVVADELQPDLRSVYGRLRQHGVRSALRSLLDRSKLTSDPGPRACTRFNLNTYRLVIVSLPRVTRSDDHATRDQIAQALDMKHVVLTEHDAAFDEIVAHRVGGGWPWQVLPSNSHFRKHYVDCAEAGHRPHLVDVLPDSPRGEIDPTYHSLPQERASDGPS